MPIDPATVRWDSEPQASAAPKLDTASIQWDDAPAKPDPDAVTWDGPPADDQPTGLLDALGRGFTRGRPMEAIQRGAASALAGSIHTVADTLNQALAPTRALYGRDPLGFDQAATQALGAEQEINADRQAAAERIGGRPGLGDLFAHPLAAIEQGTAHITNLGAESIPTMAAAIATRNPELGAAVMAGTTGAQEYTDLRGQGVDRLHAAQAAGLTGATEALGEQIGLGAILSKAGKGSLVKAIAENAAQEAPVQLAQQYIEDQTTGKQTPIGQQLGDALDAAIVGGALGGGGHVAANLPAFTRAVAERVTRRPVAPAAAAPAATTAPDAPAQPEAAPEAPVVTEAARTTPPRQSVPPTSPDDDAVLDALLAGNPGAPAATLEAEPSPAPAALGATLAPNIQGSAADATSPSMMTMDDIRAAMPRARLAGDAAASAPTPPSAPAEAAAGSPVIPRAAAPAVEPPTDTRPDLGRLRDEIGWEQQGGRLLRSAGEGTQSEADGALPHSGEGDVTGRTTWVPKAAQDGGESNFWRMRPEQGGRISEKAAHVALDKYAAGQPLNAKERRFIEYAQKTQREYDDAYEAQRREYQQDQADDASDEVVQARQALQAESIPPEDHAEALTLQQLVSRAYDAGADPTHILDATFDGTPAEQARRLWDLTRRLDEQHATDTRAIAPRREDGAGAPAERPSAVRTEPEGEGFTLANPEPRRAEAPRQVAQQSGLFAPPTPADHVRAATEARDAQRNGKVGGKTDVGDGGLFDGERPEQTRVPDAVDSTDTTRQRSVDQGNADADRLGLRAAVREALGPVADRVEYLHGYEGLPDKMRRGVESRNALGRKGVTAAMYSPGTGRVFIFTQVTKTPARAVWHAAHEIAGHEGLRELLGDRLDPALNIARQNPTVKALADEIYQQRKIAEQMKKAGRPPGDGFLLATEEALAELAAAVRTGNYEHIADRYGVDVKPSMRESVKAAIANFLRRLQAMIDDLFGKHVFTDQDVRSLLESAWQAAQNKGATEVEPKSALDSTEDQTDTPAFKRWFGDSKVVDADGKPLVVYHGGGGDVTAFDKARRGSSGGGRSARMAFWFTDSSGVASQYADESPEFARTRLYEKSYHMERFGNFDGAEKPQRDLESPDFDTGAYPNVMPTFLRIANPKIVDFGGRTYNAERDNLSAILFDAKAEGHDGVIFRNIDDAVMRGTPPADHYAVFEPEQIKSATGNRGTFDPSSPSILESTDYTPEQKEFMRKAGMAGAVDERTAIKRALDGLRDNIPHPDADVFRQGAIDKFHGLKRAVDEKGGIAPEDNPYLAAEMIQTASTMEAVLRFGAPELHQGALRVKRDVPGLLDALTPVRDQMPQWLGWMVARRAKVLKAQGRENALSDTDIAAGLSLATGHEAAFKEAALGYLKLKNAILDLAEQTGIIDPEARKAWDHAEYIPFYRDMDAGFAGPGTRQGLANQSSGIRTLKGGESPLKDPLGNIIANFTRLVDASMKNRATLLAVDQLGAPYFRKAPLEVKAETIPLDQVKRHLLDQGVDQATIDGMPPAALKGVARMLAVKAPEGEDIVRVMRGGKAEYYHVDDPLLLRSLTAFNEGGTHWSIKPLVWFKQLLTAGATATPDFLIRNALRDTGEASVTSKDRFIPVVDTVRGAIDSFRESELAQDLMMAGAAFHGGLFHTGNNEDTAKAIKRALRKHGLTDSAVERYARTLINPKRLWDIYRSVSEATEMGSRVSLARKRLAAGATPVEAAHEAKDFLNFQRRGDDTFVQAFTKVIPFLNARLQGADRLYRVGTTKGRRGKVAARLAMMAMLTTLLYWWNQEEYKDAYDEIPDWDKDANWHIAPGTDYYTRIPKPFELGLVGGTVPERMYGALRYQLTGGDAGDRPEQSWDAFMRGLTGALGINPIPQAVKPIVEDVANKDLYFGSSIEAMGDQYKAPSDRFGPTTSPTMRAASKGMAALFGEDHTISPKRLEHFWRGYTAGMGQYLLDGADWVTRKLEHAPETPDLALRDFPLIGTVARGDGPARSTRYVDEFYDLIEQAQVRSGAVKEAVHNGDPARARRIEQDWGWLIGQRVGSKRAKEGFMHAGLREMNRTRDQLSAISKDNARIYADRAMTGAAKRKALDANLEKRNALVRKAVRQIRERQRSAAG